MTETRRISHSEMKTFLRCRRKWWLSEIRRLAPNGDDPTGPLKSGSRVHTGLEAFYAPGQDPFAALKAAQDADWSAYLKSMSTYGLEPDPSAYEQFTKDCELERAMLEGYGEWVAETGVDAGLEFIATEQIVKVSGADFAPHLVSSYGHFDVVGKLDARVRREMDGARLFVDHKTARSLTDMLPTLAQDPQMLHYHWLETMTGEEGEHCDGALYNVLKKVKRGKAAKPPFYARYEVTHNAEEIESYGFRLRAIIRDMLELEARLRAVPESFAAMLAYPNPTRDCSWDCQFKALCPMFDDGSRAEAMISEQFHERDPLARYAEQAPEQV